MGAFADRVRKRMPLGLEETAFLDALEAHPTRFARNEVIARAGEHADRAFVLKSGWAMSYTRFLNGSHQVRRLHFPGDLLAMPSIPMRHHVEDIEALSDAIVAPFEKRLLAGLFKLPRLTAIMYMFAQAERVSAGDRLSCLGGTSAKGRMAFLIVDILNRLRSSEDEALTSFHMHLTREQMAHVAGMTPVHASRMWSALIQDGLIASKPPLVTILDEDRLLRLSGYVARDGDFDFGWLRSVDSPERQLDS
jgi:CRP-like cAMP-binding protein